MPVVPDNRMPTEWHKHFLSNSPMFAPLSMTGSGLNTSDWPKPPDYNQFLATLKKPPRSRHGALLQCIEPITKPERFDQRYEPAIYLRGELQTRQNNWHDLFNLLVWSTFPETKAVINERHFLAQQRTDIYNKNRSSEQDAMTLFDESGVVAACALPELEAMLKDFRWKQLFWHHRYDVIANMRFYIFGHGLFEKVLQPYPGMTGKAIIVPVDPKFLAAPLSFQIQSLDQSLATVFLTGKEIISSSLFTPLPLLGVPGWTPHNEVESYYDDTRYFRPMKTRLI